MAYEQIKFYTLQTKIGPVAYWFSNANYLGFSAGYKDEQNTNPVTVNGVEIRFRAHFKIEAGNLQLTYISADRAHWEQGKNNEASAAAKRKITEILNSAALEVLQTQAPARALSRKAAASNALESAEARREQAAAALKEAEAAVTAAAEELDAANAELGELYNEWRES